MTSRHCTRTNLCPPRAAVWSPFIILLLTSHLWTNKDISHLSVYAVLMTLNSVRENLTLISQQPIFSSGIYYFFVFFFCLAFIIRKCYYCVYTVCYSVLGAGKGRRYIAWLCYVNGAIRFPPGVELCSLNWTANASQILPKMILPIIQRAWKVPFLTCFFPPRV